MSHPRHLLAKKHRELKNRESLRTTEKVNLLLSEFFPQQLACHNDPSPFKSILAPRRAGKTFFDIVELIVTCLSKPYALCLCVGKTRSSVKTNFWLPFKQLNDKYKLEIEFHATDFSASFPNGSMVLFSGADSLDEVEKFRGPGYDLVVFDECASFSSYLLAYVIRDVVGPATRDKRGTIICSGTPGSVLQGPFWEMSGAPVSKEWAHFSRHFWTPADNTNRPDIWDAMLQYKDIVGFADDDPTWQREYLGKWVSDTSLQVFTVSDHNLLDELPLDSRGNEHEWQYLMGVDLGWHDETAFVIAAWSETVNKLCYVHAEKAPHMTILEIVKRAKELVTRFSIDRCVIDPGYGGKTLLESLRKDFGFPCGLVSARKTDKLDHLTLYNSDLKSGHILIDPEKASPLYEELCTHQWLPARVGQPRKEDPRSPNHCSDAAVYIWREAQHHLSRNPKYGPREGTKEWWQAYEQKMVEEAQDFFLAEQRTLADQLDDALDEIKEWDEI